MLIAAGVPVNHVNDRGWTALLAAVVYGDGSARYIDVITQLLDAGADPPIRYASGQTVVANAERRGQSAVVALLQLRRRRTRVGHIPDALRRPWRTSAGFTQHPTRPDES